MRLAVLCFCGVLALAKDPPPELQAQLQENLRQFVLAFNRGDRPAALQQVHAEFSFRASATGRVFGQSWQNFPKSRPPFEFTALAREVRMMTGDVALGDGFFRTVGLAGGEIAGRVTVLWLNTGASWKLAALRFLRLGNEGSTLNIEPAAQHDPPGADGWVSLLDGDGSRLVAVSGAPRPASWKLSAGVLEADPQAKRESLRTRDTYRSFELQFEWKVPPKGNSGVKYRLFYLNDWGDGTDGSGAEYQVVDDTGDPGAVNHAEERSGALYNQFAPRGAHVRPVGEFNESRLIVRGRHCEHWLNGVKVVEYDAESAPPESPILFQHHGTSIWYRNVKVRRLD
jgi:hypothetical protein